MYVLKNIKSIYIYIGVDQLSGLILIFKTNLNLQKKKLTVSWTNCLSDDAICYN